MTVMQTTISATLLFISSLALTGCVESGKSDFEQKYSNICINRGEIPKAVCNCLASELDNALTDEAKLLLVGPKPETSNQFYIENYTKIMAIGKIADRLHHLCMSKT